MEEKKKAERVKKSKQEVRAYRNEWAKENLDRFNFSMSKGKKEEIRAHAAKMGESANSFINRAIDEQIKRDNGD